jgi:hypothetical protein
MRESNFPGKILAREKSFVGKKFEMKEGVLGYGKSFVGGFGIGNFPGKFF